MAAATFHHYVCIRSNCKVPCSGVTAKFKEKSCLAEPCFFSSECGRKSSVARSLSKKNKWPSRAVVVGLPLNVTSTYYALLESGWKTVAS